MTESVYERAAETLEDLASTLDEDDRLRAACLDLAEAFRLRQLRESWSRRGRLRLVPD